MHERKPILLYGALAIPVAWFTFLIFASIMNSFFPSHAGGNVGGYDMKGFGLFILVACLSGVLGLVLTCLALWKKEKPLWLACLCFCFYFYPCIEGVLFLFGGIPHAHP